MHVAVVTTSFPFGFPGQDAAGTFVEDFAAELAKQVEVTVIAPALAPSIEKGGRLEVIRFPVPTLPLSLLDPTRPSHWPLIVQTLWRGLRAVERVAARGTLSWILALWVLPSGYWARHAARRRGIPYCSWALGSDIWTLGRQPVVRGQLRRVLRQSRLRFADGAGLCRDVERLSGKSCLLLPSCRRLVAPRARAPSVSPPYRLAFLGRWHPNKGVDLLFETLAMLCDEDWSRIEAVRVAGGGYLEELVRQRAGELTRAGRRVEIQGYLDRDQAAALYDWADWVLIPSRVESVPLVFSDAMQAGRGVVVTPAGDLPDLVRRHGVGVVARAVEPAAYGEALRAALDLDPASLGAGIERARAAFDVAASVSLFLGALDREERGG